MVGEEMEKKQVAVAAVVEGLRARYAAGRTRAAEWREAQLRGVLRMVTEMEAEICDALHADIGKPRTESYIHEISMIKNSCLFALKNLKKWMKPHKVPASLVTFPSTARITAEPLGVVLIISAWNYPLLLSLDPVIGAIASGNAVVLKPSEVAPATSSLLAGMLPRYVDGSCIKVVQGGVPETTALLDQKWDKIFYTGNSKVGRIVMASAAKHLTPVVLELGGKCPVVVDSNVDLHVAAKRIAAGKWGCNNGQACIAPDYIITTKSFAPKLVEALKKVLDKFYGKDPLLSADLSRIVNSNHFNRLKAMMDEEMVTDKMVLGGERDEHKLKIAPAIFLDVPLDSTIMKEEIFGPLLPIITVDKIHESFGLVNSMTKPLAAYLFSRDSRLKGQFDRCISAGGMLLNDTSIHVINTLHEAPFGTYEFYRRLVKFVQESLTNLYLPFGGVGDSGMGGYHGRFSFDAFSHRKAILSRGFFGEARARYPPYSPAKLRILKGVFEGKMGSMIQAILGFPRGK